MRFFTILFFIGSTLCLRAQDLRMGVKAGMNFAQVSGTGAQGFNHFGFMGGVTLHWKFAPRFSFNPELIYSMKGSRRNPDPENNAFGSYSISLDYIEVPAMFRWHFHRRDLFTVELGPTFGLLVRQQNYVDESPVNNGLFQRFRFYEIGIAAGISVHLPKGWGFTARYNNSVVPIRPESNINPYQITWGVVNSAINITVNYTFGLKKKIKDPLQEGIPPVEKPVKEKKKKQRGDLIDEED